MVDYTMVGVNVGADNYDKFYDNEQTRRENKEVQRILRNTDFEGTILDVGCGTGLAYSLLSPEQRSRYVGVDLEEGVIQRAQEKHPRGVFVQGSAQELLTSERFKTIDNLISLFAIDYIGEETMKALIQRTTGRVMFTLFNQPHLPGSSSFYQGKKSFYQERHGQNNQRIRNTLQQEGFIIRPLLQQPYHDIVTNHYNINTEDISRYRGTRT